MSTKIDEAARLNEEIRANIHPALDRDLVLNCIGTVAAGKSTFLAGVHKDLGYFRRGIGIKRGRAKKPYQIIGQSMRGINRPNATVSDVDQMPVYGYTPSGMVVIQFYAPGSHYLASSQNITEDTLAFFLDLMFYQHALEILGKTQQTEFFPFRDNGGLPCEIYTEFVSRTKLLNQTFAEHRYSTFKRDELAVTTESLLFAQEDLEQRVAQGIPVVGIQTYSSEETTNLSSEQQNTAQAEIVFNQLIGRYLTYLKERGFPDYLADKKLLGPIFGQKVEDAFRHNDRVREVDFSSIKNWYMVDSLSEERRGVKAAIYALAVSALQKAGIDTSEFRLLRFSGPPRIEGDDITIHYRTLDI